ncbi:hypothetical protein [Shinella sp.]|uniref:hypothetical protein n=2 Tax=Shinella sp. TaxID=1870904 RepID=UPI0028A6FF1E|nr:hypothetical protein [Shinella sp.]
MQTLKSVLDGAAGEDIISGEQAGALLPYMEARGVGLHAPAAADALDIGGPAEDRAIAPVEDTEAPRFIRGFHDVLITIGVAIVMAGVWGIGAFVLALPAIVILAEILVKRQRLALPAVLLTALYVHWILMTSVLLQDETIGKQDAIVGFLLTVLPLCVLLPLFYWRYRIPLSLSLWYLSLAATALGLVFFGLGRMLDSADLFTEHSTLCAGIFLATALALFTVAMRYDLSDRFRVSRRSDIAFWLHLVTAPALLYSTLSFVFLGDFANNTLFSSDKGLPGALVIVAIVVVLMGIGLAIDRRAFVTSGLLSLGVATASLLQRTTAAPESYIFLSLLIVGVVVLTIGIGWPHFRRWVLTPLPLALKEKLPPLR